MLRVRAGEAVRATATVYVERDGEELELEVTGTHTFAVRGRRGGHPDTHTPDDAAETEVDSVLLNGKPWPGEFTVKEADRAEEALREQAEQEADAQTIGLERWCDELRYGPEGS